MDYALHQDDVGTHIDWQLPGVSARHIDWFWSNMEKCFILWHPEQHEPLHWPIPPRHGNPLGAVHNAPQTWDDGRRQDLFIRFEHFDAVPDHVRALVRLEHVMIVAGLGLEESCIHAGNAPLGYRVHQWEDAGGGVKGSSSAIGLARPETHEDGRIWAAHAATEIGNWAVFLPELHRLYQVVTDTRRNPFADLSVSGKGLDARYCFIEA